MLFKWVACIQFQKQFNFYLKSFFSEIGLFLRWCDDLWYHLISDTTSLMHLRETISNINVYSYQGNKFFEHKTFPIWLYFLIKRLACMMSYQIILECLCMSLLLSKFFVIFFKDFNKIFFQKRIVLFCSFYKLTK